jgi:transketolase
MVTNTGSLGMGISKAKGMLFGRGLAGKSGRIFVMTGDGELQEGQIWESLVSAANQRLSNLTVLVDHNKLQSDTLVAGTSALGDLEAKFQAFGWYTERVNGHDFEALGRAFARARAVTERPQVLILDTVKGKGVSFMEGVATDSDTALYRFHSGAPSASDYELAVAELLASLRAGYDAAGLPHPGVESIEQASIPQTGVRQSLIAAYSKALLEEMQRTPNAVVLDADLLVDTGQLPSKQAFPERHLECGIAETDMVSQAGGMALEGALPICHSFACFLSARPNEQMYNNATERSKVVYVASLAGIVPGGPGHSHQGVRDISATGAIPGLVLLEPATESDVEKALDFALHGTTESVYLRLVSVPWEVPESAALPAARIGVGHLARPGGDVLLFAYGPVLVAEALKAANDLVADGLDVGVVHLPWLNRVDDTWFRETIRGARLLVFLDNHYEHGGQGDLLCAALAKSGIDGVRACKHGIREIPVSGTHAEVLAHHGLDAAGIARRVRSEL